MTTPTHSHLDSRACSRCGLPLTDTISFQRGVGPICAKQDKKLFALTVPANYGQITLELVTMDLNTIPDLVNDERNPKLEFDKVKASLLAKSKEAVSSASVQEIMNLSIKGQDLSKEVRVLDWLCSFDLGFVTKNAIINIVRAAGYVALASVLAGEASTGKSIIGFDNGILTLCGSKCKSGYKAFAKFVNSGVKLPNYQSKIYFVPSALINEFVLIVQEFWPMFDENLQSIIDQAVAWNATHEAPPVTQSSIINNKPSVKIVEGTEYFTLTFSSFGKSGLTAVDRLKARVSYKDRKYDPVTRLWTIFRPAMYLEKVKEVLEESGFQVCC